MSTRDFFILLIKVFGLYSLILTLFSLPGVIANYVFPFYGMEIILLLVVGMVVSFGLIYLLIKMAPKLVDLLRITDGFESPAIQFGQLTAAEIVKIGTFTAVGFLLLDCIPDFLTHTFYFFKTDVGGREYGQQEMFDWVLSGVTIVFCWFLLTNLPFVARLVEGKDAKEID